MNPWAQAIAEVVHTFSSGRIIGAAVALILVLVGFAALRRSARKRVETLPAATNRRFVFQILSTFGPLPALLIGVGLAGSILGLPSAWGAVARTFLVLGVGLQAGLVLSTAVSLIVEREVAKRRAKQQQGLASLGIFRLIGQVVVWSLVLLFTLDKVGIDVTGLVASLGVGGIAVALAAQNILGDLFASLSIVLDRPFEVGDFIMVGTEIGSVESIGLKSTRVKALSGEQIVVGNADLLRSRVRNFKKMAERRVVIRFGVLYSSDRAQLERVPEICQRAVEKLVPRARFDRAHLDVFAASSLEFELVYYVIGNDFVVHQDLKQAILLDLFDELQALGLGFAFPTQTLHVASMPEQLERSA